MQQVAENEIKQKIKQIRTEACCELFFKILIMFLIIHRHLLTAFLGQHSFLATSNSVATEKENGCFEVFFNLMYKKNKYIHGINNS